MKYQYIKYVDVIVYQFYGLPAEHEALLNHFVPKVNLPFMNGDSGFSSPSEMMPNSYGTHAKNQAQRAEWLLKSDPFQLDNLASKAEYTNLCKDLRKELFAYLKKEQRSQDGRFVSMG